MTGKVSKAGELETVGSLVHSRRPRGLQCPNPFAQSDFLKDGVLLPAFVDDQSPINQSERGSCW